MDTSILIVKALGIYLVTSGIFVLFRGKSFPLVLKDLFDHPAMMWLAGLVLIVIGGMLALSGSDNIVVSVLGWATLVKGVIYIIYPEIFSKLITKSLIRFTPVWGIVYMALGVWLISLN